MRVYPADNKVIADNAIPAGDSKPENAIFKALAPATNPSNPPSASLNAD